MKFSTTVAVFSLVAVGVQALPQASRYARVRRQNQFVTGPCQQDNDCQQGCCAFRTGKCAGPGIAQTRDGGCGFGNPTPNCNVAAALGLRDCAPGAVNGNLADPVIQEKARFVAQLNGLPFTPAAGPPPPPAGNVGGNVGGNAGGFTVVAGDTCTAIAQRTGTQVAALIAANPGINAGCTNLQVGQTLNAPGAGGNQGGNAPPAAGPPRSAAELAASQQGKKVVAVACANDNECQQGCCAFRTGKCAGPAIAQSRDGGCGFSNPTPNCNVATLIGFRSQCVNGAVEGNLRDPQIQAAAAFSAQINGIAFTPSK